MGQVDRTLLGPLVFQDQAKRRQLAKITSGPIAKTIFKQLLTLRWQNMNSEVILDAPLLFENKVLEHFCYPIVVIAIEDE